ncbi:MAG TPA: cytochrome c family protein [Rhizomicrobium sp.]|jgi:cytochrome c|nr:cytochrome c family protein [Rhizomicrobium sp.]
MSNGRIAALSVIAAAILATPALAAGDAVQGKAVFARCAICHNVEKDGGNGVGPNLFGIAGRKAATVDGFNYSGPMKASGITWTDDNLEKWIAGPAKMLPGTKMAFAGITSKTQIADVIAYLHTLK